MSRTLEQAFAELQTNEELARRFSEKPEEVLKELGVEAENLQITQIPNPRATEQTGGAASLAAPVSGAGITVCVSAGTPGIPVCVSAGGDFATARASATSPMTKAPGPTLTKGPTPTQR